MCKEIPLTQGKVALVSDEDYERVTSLRWMQDRKGYLYRDIYEHVSDSKRRHRRLSLQNFILGAEIGIIVDHKNRNTLDYRRENLRIATRAQNNANSGPRGNAKYKGISFHKRDKVWVSQITIDGKYHHLGNFKCPEDAVRAYDLAALTAWGEFAYLNFPHLRNSYLAAINVATTM